MMIEFFDEPRKAQKRRWSCLDKTVGWGANRRSAHFTAQRAFLILEMALSPTKHATRRPRDGEQTCGLSTSPLKAHFLFERSTYGHNIASPWGGVTMHGAAELFVPCRGLQ